MESMNGYLEKRGLQRNMRLDSDMEDIKGMVKSLQADVDQIEVVEG